MPRTTVVIYQESDGSAPLLDWLGGLPEKTQDKCIARIELLGERGFELRRPACDYLDDGIYELRIRAGHVQCRILYGFVGQNIVLLSHGCTKEGTVPRKEITRAAENLGAYLVDPEGHTSRESLR